MYFRACARFAELHADLADLVERVDARLTEMEKVEVLRSGDLACVLGADPNQVASILDSLAEQGVLLREEMVECRCCETVVPREDYETQLDEDGEYLCSGCERPLTKVSIRPVTTFRSGDAWTRRVENLDPPADRVCEPALPYNAGLDENAFYTYDDLARLFGVDREALRKRLDRYRRTDFGEDWKEKSSRDPREAKYLYRLRAVRPILDELRASR
jgi:hypothetical protein